MNSTTLVLICFFVFVLIGLLSASDWLFIFSFAALSHSLSRGVLAKSHFLLTLTAIKSHDLHSHCTYQSYYGRLSLSLSRQYYSIYSLYIIVFPFFSTFLFFSSFYAPLSSVSGVSSILNKAGPSSSPVSKAPSSGILGMGWPLRLQTHSRTQYFV